MDESLTILVIEDDPDALANLCDILELDGHELVGAASLEEATRQARKRSFDVAISDRKLPDGLIEDRLPELKEVVGDAEIIVVTGYADMQSTITAFRRGVSDYVIKPIIPEDLRQTVLRIAEKRRLQDELTSQNAFAENILDTAEAVVLTLDLSGTVIGFNPYFEQLTGWDQQSLVGRDWFVSCVPANDRDRVREIFIRTAHDIHTRGVINAVVDRDGRQHQIRWSNTVLKDKEGNATSVLAVGVDVSDLEEAQERALRAERLATIGQTMTALAHESRNALQRIQAATEMLGLEVEDNPTAQHDLASIQRASRDLQRLLDEVRSYAAPIQIRATENRLPEVWRRVWSDLRHAHCERDVQIDEQIEDGDTRVEVDALRIEQVLRNLYENALAACSDPVKLKLTFRRIRDQVELTFSDNGPGMSKSQMEKAFEPFFTTKSTGTGLGLAICQRIIDAHEGSITLESSAKGAKFVIRLPIQLASDHELLL